MFKKNDKRFVIKEEHRLGFGGMQIIVDTVTGVNYLLTVGAAVSGITPLLDENGKVIVDGKESE